MHKHLKKIILACFIVICFSSYSQTTIKGKTLDAGGKGISDALIVLTNKEHHTIFSATSDSLGVFEILLPENLKDKILYVTCFGYKSKQIENISANDVRNITLEALYYNLEGVEISASRPVITRENDKFLVSNVYESPIAKGKDAADFLKYTPMIGDVKENSVSILGAKGNATIYVNGRESLMDLRSIPAESIERIEIISNPGSRYPADSRNGIINVVLRKAPDDGMSVTVRAEDRQNRKNSPSGNVFLDIKKGKTNITTGIRASYFGMLMEDKSIYNYFSDSLTTDVNRNTDFSNSSVSPFVNFSYALSKKHEIGFQIDAMFRNNKTEESTETFYRQLNASAIDSSDLTRAQIKPTQLNYGFHSNLNYSFDIREGQKLTADFDYRRSLSDNQTKYHYSIDSLMFATPSDFMIYPKILIDGYAFKTDFTHTFDEDKTLDVGIKMNGAMVNNDYFYGIYTGSGYMSDSLKTNRFLFNDLTAAAYANYSWVMSDHWELNAGLRAEYYAYKGDQKATEEKIDDQYMNVFPTFSALFIPNDNHEFGFDFSSSIFRPGYYDLNPFKTFYSPNLYEENNPYLKPSIDYEFELSYILMSDYMFFIDYTYSKNTFTEFTMPAGNGVTKIMKQNYDRDHCVDFIISINKSLFKNYFNFTINADFSYIKAEGFPEGVIADNTEYISGSVSANINVALNKKKDFRMLSRFQYRPTSRSVAFTLKTSYYWDVSIAKNFKNSTLSFGVNNIIYKPWELSLTDATYSYATERNLYGRTFWASYSIKFGNTKVKKVYDRKNEDLDGRMLQ